MGLSLPKDKQKRAILIAIFGSIFAGAATMLIPVSLLEAITGTTGLSEIIPATAAPLGDKARALIAFGTGALTLAVIAIFLLRKSDASDDMSDADQQKADLMGSERAASLKQRLPKINMPTMPWDKQDDEVRSLEDLPKLREKDIHPDAPPRMPLSADRDLTGTETVADCSASPEAVLNSLPSIPQEQDSHADEPLQQQSAPNVAAEQAAEYVEPEVPEQVLNLGEALVTEEPVSESQPVMEQAAAPVATAQASPAAPQVEVPIQSPAVQQVEAEPQPDTSMLTLVEQLQSAIEKRSATQQELAAVSSKLKEALSDENAGEEKMEKPAVKAPPLKAVENIPEDTAPENGEMDGALNAALETLQRMNAQAR